MFAISPHLSNTARSSAWSHSHTAHPLFDSASALLFDLNLVAFASHVGSLPCGVAALDELREGLLG